MRFLGWWRDFLLGLKWIFRQSSQIRIEWYTLPPLCNMSDSFIIFDFDVVFEVYTQKKISTYAIISILQGFSITNKGFLNIATT